MAQCWKNASRKGGKKGLEMEKQAIKTTPNISDEDYRRLVAYVNGSLGVKETLEALRFIFENPGILETVNQLKRLKRTLGKGVDLQTYLDEETDKIMQKIKDND